MSASKRLEKELQRMKDNKTDGIIIDLENCTTFKWKAAIEGPVGTPFEGGDFLVVMDFPKDYPFKPPRVRFETKMFHPNVFTNGDICLDILQNQWQPTYTGEKTLLSIQSLFTDPNPASPANGKAGSLFDSNRAEYEKEVKKFTQKHASANYKKRKEAERKVQEAAEKAAQEKEQAAGKRKREEAPAEQPPPQKSPEERLVEEMQAEGLTNVDLLKSLIPIVGGDKELLKSLYAGQSGS